MDPSPSILSLREAPRKRLGLAYEAVTARWGAEFGEASRPSVSKIHRWENGSRSREPDFVEQLCAIYGKVAEERGVDISAELEGLRASEHMQEEPRVKQAVSESEPMLPEVLPDGPPLRFGLVAYPDSAIMAAVVKGLFGEQVEIVALNPGQGANVPDMILAGELDFGLHNSVGLMAHAAVKPGPKQSPLQWTAVMRFRGNALLTASGQGNDGAKPWTTFKEHYMNNADAATAPDHTDRVLNALARTLYQLVDGRHKIDPAHLALPGAGSNRRQALIQMLRLAQSSKFITPVGHSKLEPSKASGKLEAFITAIEKSAEVKRTGVEAFYEFAKAIDPGSSERTRALFYAGATHRLIAESEFAAAPLIDTDDLLLLAALPPGYHGVFFPTNVLVRLRATSERMGTAMRMLRNRWNRLAQGDEDWAHTVETLNTDVDRHMLEALEKYGDAVISRASWRSGKKLFGQLLERQMVDLLPWLELIPDSRFLNTESWRRSA